MHNKKQLRFLFPETEITSKECLAMLEMLQAHKSPLYSITLERANRTSPSLILSILFDPSFVEITYDVFDAISLYKGLVFTFYDKKFLEKIKDTADPLIRTVFYDAPAQVIIDCGHGGHDVGAIGCNGLQEKDVTLTIGLKLSALLNEQGIKTFLTRACDVFVPLDDRTRCLPALNRNSVFISLHANFAERQAASGIETFCLSPPLLKRSFETMKSYESELLGYILCEKHGKSFILATAVHDNLIMEARRNNPNLNDRHIKHAVSQVLLGPVIPTVLIELGFVSNRHEASLLQRYEYQQALAKGISNGVLAYLKSVKEPFL